MKNQAEPVDTNKNVNWMHAPHFWTFYICLILALRAWMPLFVTDAHAWTATNVVHGAISFLIMHWIKGSPDTQEQGEYRDLTFYEQIDEGRPWTSTKKILIIIPTVLFAIASISTDYRMLDLLINFPVWFVLILGKLPEFHRVRIFGINSTVGIDDAWKVSGNIEDEKALKKD